MVGSILVALWLVLMGLLRGPAFFMLTLSFTEVPEERSPLMLGLKSYQDIETTTALLEKGGYSQWTLYNDYSDADGGESPVNFSRITVDPFVHFDCPSRLILRFLNNRLAEAVVCPMQIQPYLHKLAKEKGIRFDPLRTTEGSSEQETFLPPYTRIHILPRISQFPPCVVWSDTRLDWEEWVYSAKYED